MIVWHAACYLGANLDPTMILRPERREAMFPRLRTTPWQAAQVRSFPGLSQFFNHVTHELSNTLTRDAVPAFPPINVWEKDDTLYVEAALAGYLPKDVKVSVVGDELVLEGAPLPLPSNGGSGHRRERNLNAFKRAVYLPSHVDEEKVTARCANGMLTVQLPKARTALPREIKVEVTHS